MSSLAFGLIFLICVAAALVAPPVAIWMGMRATNKLPWQRRLLARGESAPALVLESRRTGVTFNYRNDRVLKLTLEVRPQGRQPFRAEARKLVAGFAAPQYQPGAVVEVKFDPSGPRRVVVTGDAARSFAAPPEVPFSSGRAPATQGADQVERLRQLKAMLDAGLISADDYEAKKSEILSRI